MSTMQPLAQSNRTAHAAARAPHRKQRLSWGAFFMFCVALAYATAPFLVHPAQSGLHEAVSGAVFPLQLFAVGLSPVIGAGLVIVLSPNAPAYAKRKLRLGGAVMSVLLFVPAFLLLRFFG